MDKIITLSAYTQNQINLIDEKLSGVGTEEERERLLELRLKHQQNLLFLKDLK